MKNIRPLEVKAGNLIIGGNAPVSVQSMTNTDTMDTEATVEQSMRLFDAGCRLVRITAPGVKEALNLENIKNRLVQKGYNGPLCADIHFMPEAALKAAGVVEKVRINPGNYTDRRTGKTVFSAADTADERRRIKERIAPLLEVCKKHGTAIRIGVNQGSISERMVARYGHTPQAMVESAMEFLRLCEEENFTQIVVSLKSSRVDTMNRAVRMMAERMNETGTVYPLHLGVTEAGNGEDARLISAIGIGGLLKDGIGNTVRVSLTETPENEIPVAEQIIRAARECRLEPGLNGTRYTVKDTGEYEKIKAAVEVGSAMLQQPKTEYKIEGADEEECRRLLDDIYQAAGLRFHKTRFIACPSCGRTKYDIQSALAKVKERFPDYPDTTIAVMGCIVNGPGEMAGADYGYIGCGNGKVNLYKEGQLVKAAVDEQNALAELEKIITAARKN